MTGEISLCKLRITLKNGKAERTASLLQVPASGVKCLRVANIKNRWGKGCCLIETFPVALAVHETDADFLVAHCSLRCSVSQQK